MVNRELKEQPFVYKDYIASIEYSRQDNKFIGRVKGMMPTIEFCGTDITELESEFHRNVDVYLENCKKWNIPPNKQYSGALYVDLPQEIHCYIAFMCEEMGVSIEQFLKHAIMVSLHEMEMTVSDMCAECRCSENINADNNADMFEIYEEILEDIEKQIGKLGKVFFYRNIAAEIMFHDDGAWEGRLLNVSKEYNFDAETLEELYNAFTVCVDEYYEDYKEKEEKPSVYYDGNLSFELPPLLHYLLEIIADMEDQSVDTVLKFFTSMAISMIVKNMDFDEDRSALFKRMLGVE